MKTEDFYKAWDGVMATRWFVESLDLDGFLKEIDTKPLHELMMARNDVSVEALRIMGENLRDFKDACIEASSLPKPRPANVNHNPSQEVNV